MAKDDRLLGGYEVLVVVESDTGDDSLGIKLKNLPCQPATVGVIGDKETEKAPMAISSVPMRTISWGSTIRMVTLIRPVFSADGFFACKLFHLPRFHDLTSRRVLRRPFSDVPGKIEQDRLAGGRR